MLCNVNIQVKKPHDASSFETYLTNFCSNRHHLSCKLDYIICHQYYEKKILKILKREKIVYIIIHHAWKKIDVNSCDIILNHALITDSW